MSVLRHAVSSFTRASPVVRTQVRRIHPTTLALKKKAQRVSSSQNHARKEDDEFAFDASPEQDELFGSTPATSSKPAQPASDFTPQGSSLGVKTPELLQLRAEMFETQLISTTELITRPGKLRQPPKRTTIQRLVGLTETKEQLKRVVELLALWRDASLPYNSHACDEFIGRCITLNCPELALEVLRNRPKYGVDVPTLETARHLLNELAKRRSSDDGAQALRDTLALAELYPLYGFPPASEDTISCVILAGVMAREYPSMDPASVEKKEGEVADVSDPFSEILAELKGAAASWEGAGETRPQQALRWMRRSMIHIAQAVRQRGGKSEPWLRELSRQAAHPIAVSTTA